MRTTEVINSEHLLNNYEFHFVRIETMVTVHESTLAHEFLPLVTISTLRVVVRPPRSLHDRDRSDWDQWKINDREYDRPRLRTRWVSRWLDFDGKL